MTQARWVAVVENCTSLVEVQFLRFKGVVLVLREIWGQGTKFTLLKCKRWLYAGNCGFSLMHKRAVVWLVSHYQPLPTIVRPGCLAIWKI